MLVALLLRAEELPRIQETIVVVGERLDQPRRETTAAVSVLHAEELARLPARTLGDAIGLVPGLQLVHVNPGAPPMISSRGFFGAGEVEYVQLIIDGVPAGDMESGLADWRSIPIEAIEHVEVLRGAGSSLFGDTALGGVVQVFRRPSSHVSLSAGSFESRRWSAAYATDSFSASASGATSDGFRAHGASEELFANVRADAGRLHATFDASHRRRDDPGARSGEEMESDPFGSHEMFAFDEEESRRVRGSVQWRGAFEMMLHGHDRHSDQTRTLLIAPDFGDRATRVIDTSGVGANVVKTLTLREGRVVGGIDAAHEQLRSSYGETRGNGRRRRGAAFVSGEWNVTPVLRIAAGARWDSIDDAFESTNIGDDAFSPRLGASFDLGAITAYAQLSRAFKAPTIDQRFDQRPIAGFTISNPALRAQHAKNVEIGMRGAMWDVVAYLTTVDDEIDFDVRTFRYANIGRSRHRGVEASVRQRFATLSYTWTRVEGTQGHQLKNIAEHVVRAGFDVRTFVDVYLGVEHSAGRWLDDDNGFALDDATIADLRVAKTIGAITAALEAHNLFDVRYSPLGFALGDVPYHYPAAGRSVSMVLAWKRGTP